MFAALSWKVSVLINTFQKTVSLAKLKLLLQGTLRRSQNAQNVEHALNTNRHQTEAAST